MWNFTNKTEMYKLYPNIMKINEKKITQFFISPVTLTSYFDAALKNLMKVKGLYWLFLSKDSMFPAVRKRFLRLNVIYRLRSNVLHIC